MPQWNIAHPPGAFDPEIKKAFAKEITRIYSELGLPRFYVNVFFWECAKDDCFIGGEPTDDFVRIWIDHIALDTIDETKYTMDQTRAWVGMRIGATVKPFVKDRGYRWELHIDDTPFELWIVDGIFPPRIGSDMTKTWAEANRPIAFDYNSPENIPKLENMPTPPIPA